MIALFPISKNKSFAGDEHNAYRLLLNQLIMTPFLSQNIWAKYPGCEYQASRCGFTSQYNKMQKLWEKYKDSD